MTTIWQKLGAFVETAQNLSDSRVRQFAQAGGRWICPVIHGDDISGPWNLEHIEVIKAICAQHGVAVGGWYNVFGGEPVQEAAEIAAIHKHHGLALCILDLEGAYQYPQGKPNLLPAQVKAVRSLLPAAEIGVSTYFLNNSGIYNGRTLTPPQSFADLKIRALPQWYNSPAYGQGQWTRPDQNMKWLKENGKTDGNFADRSGLKPTYGVPLSYVHGTLEVTSEEGAALAGELAQLTAAKQYGFTYGFSIYTLENTPDSDFALLAAQRGKLFLA